MSPADRSADTRDCGGDVAAYALGALDPTEVEEFRAHLKTCASCREDLDAFKQVVDVLPLSAPRQAAPRGLRRRVVGAVREDVKRAQRGKQARGRRAITDRFSIPRPAVGLAALLAVAVIVVGAIALSNSSSTRVVTAQVTGERGTAQVKVSGNHAQLIVRDFSQPPAGKVYEVWLSRTGQKPTPSALFTVTPSGNSEVDVPESVHGVNALLVTPEPKGGSSAPTHAPVISAQLS